MLIDKNLSWKHHISYIASKISMLIGIIDRLRHFIPLHTLHHIYKITYPTLFIVWNCSMGCAGKIYRTKILHLHKQALRLMFFGDYKSHTVPFFIFSNLLPLGLLYFKSVAILMHDVFNNLLQPQLTNVFTPITQDHCQDVISLCNTLD